MRIGRVFVGGFLFVGLFVVGLFLLIRGCLARYDERFALAPVLYFERQGKAVLFSLVEYDKTNNYSSRGGIVRKSVSASYHLQQNDAVSGLRTGLQLIKHHSDIKHFPVEVLGASAVLAWIFAGELMAFDPFTLEKKADVAILESKNPTLKGMFPTERRYYNFNPADQHVYFTANDGAKWQLNTTTLLAVPSSGQTGSNPFRPSLESLEKLQQLNRAAQDSLYKGDYPGKLYGQGKINAKEYQRLQNLFIQRREALYRERDSLQQAISSLRELGAALQRRQSAIQNLQRPNPFYDHIKVNQDTLNGQWYGVYAQDEWEALHHRVQLQSNHDETARGQLYQSSLALSRNNDWTIEKEKADLIAPSQYFLHSGFLIDKSTAAPIHLSSPQGFLVVHKDKIGQEGTIQLSRVSTTGQVNWTFATGLTAWIDWLYTGKQLFVLGVDNPELTSSQANVLWCIDLNTGKAARYDYFADRQR